MPGAGPGLQQLTAQLALGPAGLNPALAIQQGVVPQQMAAPGRPKRGAAGNAAQAGVLQVQTQQPNTSVAAAAGQRVRAATAPIRPGNAPNGPDARNLLPGAALRQPQLLATLTANLNLAAQAGLQQNNLLQNGAPAQVATTLAAGGNAQVAQAGQATPVAGATPRPPTAQQHNQQIQLINLFRRGELLGFLQQRVQNGVMTQAQADQMFATARVLSERQQAMAQAQAQAQAQQIQPAGSSLGQMPIQLQLQVATPNQPQPGTAAATQVSNAVQGGLVPALQLQPRAELLRTMAAAAAGAASPAPATATATPEGAGTPVAATLVGTGRRPPSQQQLVTRVPSATVTPAQRPEPPGPPIYDPAPFAKDVFGPGPMHGMLGSRERPPAGTTLSRGTSFVGMGAGGISAGPPPVLQMPELVGDGERLKELIAKVGAGERVDPEAAEVRL